MADLADEDFELVSRAQRGDFAAFEALTLKYERRVFGLARRIVGHHEDAEEVVQQTFLSLIEHIEGFRAESRFLTWLLRVATNHALALLRRRAIRQTLPLVDDHADDSYANVPHPSYVAEWSETPDDLATRREARALIDQALAELDDKYRLVFVLRDIEGLSTDETAEALDISSANVKVRLLRARLMLRERLTRWFGDEGKQIDLPHNHQ